MSFPLYRRPGGVAFLDDDPDYLEMLAQVMPADWPVSLYLQPVDCINALQQEPARWEADTWKQQEMINRWHEGLPLIPQVLRYWQNDGSTRFSLTHVCVVDYSMPAMSGLRVLSELNEWSGSRILLTGRADEQLAVSAFNRGLIEQFIPKQSPELRQRLTEAIRQLLELPNPRHQNMWRSTLSREQNAVLCVPSVANDLRARIQQQGWIEHIVVGAPFGVLGLNAQAEVSWLQLELPEKLAELADMAATQGWPSADRQAIRSGEKIVDLELQLALGSEQKPELRPSILLGTERQLHGAIFPLPATWAPAPEASYARFIASQGERILPD